MQKDRETGIYEVSFIKIVNVFLWSQCTLYYMNFQFLFIYLLYQLPEVNKS